MSRLIDADAYAAKMKEKQDACKVALKGADGTERECWERAYAVFVEAKLTLDSMPTFGGWISVKDRKPPIYQMVLITGKNSAGGSLGIIKGSYDGRNCGWYRDDIGWYLDSRGDIVTHWMLLPELPKEVREND